MSANKSESVTSPEDVKQSIAAYMRGKSFSHVSFHENQNPFHDSKLEDYRVVYEMEMLPQNLTQPYFKLLLYENGMCDIGVEMRSRIAKRVGTFLLTGRSAFAVGREMITFSGHEIYILLNIIGSGRFCLQAHSGILGLGRTNIYFPRETMQNLVIHKNRTWDWVVVADTVPKGTLRSTILIYDGW